MRSTIAWIRAARPATWPAAFVPVAVGSAVAMRAGAFRWDAAIAAVFGALFIQIGTNFANDVFDFEQGADTEARLGPARAVASGWVAPGEMRVAMWTAFFVATIAGVYLTGIAGPGVIAMGVASIAAGIAYTKGEKSLAYLGLGDVFVLAFFGIVAVAGTAFVCSREVMPLAIAYGIAVGAIATAILVVNNVRDRETDVAAKKRTLVVRFGRAFGIAEYVALLATAYAVVIGAVAMRVLAVGALLPLATVPLAVLLVRELARGEGRALNATLAKTGMLLAAFGGLAAIGIATG